MANVYPSDYLISITFVLLGWDCACYLGVLIKIKYVLRYIPESGATTSSSIQPSTVVTAAATNEPVRSKSPPRKESTKATPEFTANVEQALLLMLGEVTLSLPCDVQTVTDSLNKSMHIDIALTLVEDLLHKLAAQALIRCAN